VETHEFVSSNHIIEQSQKSLATRPNTVSIGSDQHLLPQLTITSLGSNNLYDLMN